ncbi:MAG: hypothetical protein WBY01_09080, partial [Pseudolabrys sp.]
MADRVSSFSVCSFCSSWDCSFDSPALTGFGGGNGAGAAAAFVYAKVTPPLAASAPATIATDRTN